MTPRARQRPAHGLPILPDGACRVRAAGVAPWLGVALACLALLSRAPRVAAAEPNPKGAVAHSASTRPTHLWAFTPVQRPPVPAVPGRPRPSNPIDAFIEARLAAQGIAPNPPASRRVLLRRASFDLVGLPPTFEDVQAFERDARPDAWERRVESLLASPQHGERWGRHWLDVVRFAQSNGYERDGEKKGAWRYRDHVIGAFNRDLPWDQFVREHVAGDELEPFTPGALLATGFLRLGVLDDEPDDKEMAAFDDLDDVLSTTGVAFMGLTLGCARCHDHKFDPLPQADYYRLLAFFRGLAPAKDVSNPSASTAHVPLADPVEVAAWHRQREARVRDMEAELARATDEKARKDWRGRIDAARKELPPFELALGARESGTKPPDTFVLRRGSARSPGEPAPPGFPTALVRGHAAVATPADPGPGRGGTSGRRRVLADWMASRGHPLTARVIVNRLWHHHFGRGLVRTTGDFGAAGTPPTHPELLDWLACELMDHGWSLKHVHRLILGSEAWRRSSRADPSMPVATKDPGNELWWRQGMRRLEAEAARDMVLFAGGDLNLHAGGRGFFPTLAGEVLEGGSRPGTDWEVSPAAEQSRRAVYAFVRRTSPVPWMEALDYSNATVPLTERPVTTVAPQALLLLNDDFMRSQARAMAARVASGGRSRGEALREAWRRVLSREPSPEELSVALAHAARHEAAVRALPGRFTVRTDVPATMSLGYFGQLHPRHFVSGPSGWAALKGHWPDQYEGNQIVSRGEGPAMLATGARFASGTARARLIPHAGLERGGWLLGAVAEGQRVRGMEVLVEPREARVSVLWLAPEPRVLASARREGIESGADLRVVVADGRARVWAGRDGSGEPLMDVALPGPLPAAGVVGLRAWGAPLSAEDIVLETTGGSVALRPDAAEADPARRALEATCLMLLNLNEALYVE